jgi:hypothetical protein
MARLLNRAKAPVRQTLRTRYAAQLRKARAHVVSRNGDIPDMRPLWDQVWPPEDIRKLEETTEPFGVFGWQIANLLPPKTVEHYKGYIITGDGRLIPGES